jgi:indole-3-glycerol phosphate synthase
MAAASRRRLEAARRATPVAALERELAGLPPPATPLVDDRAFHLIAEVKRRSPSAGQLAGVTMAPAEQARRYALGGALAVSVLTEPESFDGDLAHVTEVHRALPALPVMRKDFLVEPYQVLEARVAGASGVLLVAAILEPRSLAAMFAAARGLSLFVLLEVFDAADLAGCEDALLAAAAADPGRVLLGVNCRDLRTLQVDFARFAMLAPRLPRALPWVAESGIESPTQVATVARLGYSLALVGTALMRAGDPTAAAQALLAAGRAAHRRPR